MSGSTSNCQTTKTCQNHKSSGSGYLIVLVIYILLAIILGSYYII